MSLAPVAPLNLARFPLSLVATSRLYLLCRLPQSLHSDLLDARLVREIDIEGIGVWQS